MPRPKTPATHIVPEPARHDFQRRFKTCLDQFGMTQRDIRRPAAWRPKRLQVDVRTSFERKRMDERIADSDYQWVRRCLRSDHPLTYDDAEKLHMLLRNCEQARVKTAKAILFLYVLASAKALQRPREPYSGRITSAAVVIPTKSAFSLAERISHDIFDSVRLSESKKKKVLAAIHDHLTLYAEDYFYDFFCNINRDYGSKQSDVLKTICPDLWSAEMDGDDDAIVDDDVDVVVQEW